MTLDTYKNACLTYINKGEINLWNEVALQQCIKSNTIKFKGLEIKNNHWYEIDTLQDYEQENLFSISNICLDLDGTVYKDNVVFPGLIKALNILSQGGLKYFILQIILVVQLVIIIAS